MGAAIGVGATDTGTGEAASIGTGATAMGTGEAASLGTGATTMGASGNTPTWCVDPIPRQETNNDTSTRNPNVKAIRRFLFIPFLLM